MPVFWQGKKITREIRGLMGKRLEKAARMLRNYARVKSSRSQPTRGVGTLKRGLDPSKPGEYPKVVSGTHRRMIAFEVDRKTLTARIGSNLVYARHLELGTRKMKRRPWLSRALAESMGQLRKILQ